MLASVRLVVGIVFVEFPSRKQGISGTRHMTCSAKPTWRIGSLELETTGSQGPGSESYSIVTFSEFCIGLRLSDLNLSRSNTEKYTRLHVKVGSDFLLPNGRNSQVKNSIGLPNITLSMSRKISNSDGSMSQYGKGGIVAKQSWKSKQNQWTKGD